ncbi:hypothetical protein [Hymenobacter sp. B81]|uniref:hypothetical protein n=1 Tax=Hymenobacter sp. B81 TaxID=3344878 RepID=UPI0037DC814A
MLLVPGTTYVFIDALNTDDFCSLPRDEWRSENLLAARAKVFPYCDDPYALFQADHRVFELARIVHSATATPDDLHEFCSDSGLMLVIETAQFFEFIGQTDFDTLADLIEDNDTLSQWPEPLQRYTGKAYLFRTSEIAEHFAGGGNFRIQ